MLSDIQIISNLFDLYPPLSDREARVLDQRDPYNSRLQFGDPFLFLHINVDFARRVRDLEHLHFFETMDQSGADRSDYVNSTMEAFPDVRMITEGNMERFFRTHKAVTMYINHILVVSRP